MQMPLTLNDINNAQIFLNRVEIKGNEAMAMAELQMKLQQIGSALQQAAQQQAAAQAAPPAPPAEEPPMEEEIPPEAKPSNGNGKGARAASKT